MLLKPAFRPLKSMLTVCLIYFFSLSLKSQSSGEGTMTQFYIVIIVFAVIVLGAVISFFVSSKKRKD